MQMHHVVVMLATFKSLQCSLQGIKKIRRNGKRDTRALCVEAQVEITRQRQRFRARGILLKDESEPGDCCQALATRPRSERYALQVHRCRAQRADGIDQKPQAASCGGTPKHAQVIEDTRGCFTMNCPDPPERRVA